MRCDLVVELVRDTDVRAARLLMLLNQGYESGQIAWINETPAASSSTSAFSSWSW